ncbi:MAG: hypothetical protein ACRDRH_15575, partial [Pseudonocardia sp.]
MFQYFGVHFTILDLTAQDYLVRSAGGLPLPLILVVGSALLALWVHRLLLRERFETGVGQPRRVVILRSGTPDRRERTLTHDRPCVD